MILVVTEGKDDKLVIEAVLRKLNLHSHTLVRFPAGCFFAGSGGVHITRCCFIRPMGVQFVVRGRLFF